MTIFERLQTYFKYKELTFNRVSDELGFSSGLLSKGLKNPNASLGSEKIIKILENFPELSAEWLLREEGNMLKEVFQKSVHEDCLLCEEKDKLVYSYKEQISQLQEDKEWLRKQIELSS